MARWAKRIAVVAGLVAFFATAKARYDRYQFPYGWSHCCDTGLALSLHNYADQHDGWFPRGEATPEASLSLLYRYDPTLLNMLRGKSVTDAVVRARLEAGELLTPETCGWHYIEGLRSDDPPDLVVFWDKAGLGHNGERLPEGGRFVGFVGAFTRFIPSNEWQSFVAQQERWRTEIMQQR